MSTTVNRVTAATILLAAGCGLTVYCWPVERGEHADYSQRGPLCGHWAALRCCEVLGAPLSIEDIVALLPARRDEHSLGDLAGALESVGFRVKGRRETPRTLAAAVPCIAHLIEPDHFVFVDRCDEKEVHLFDCQGRPFYESLSRFSQKWSGYVIRVRRPERDEVLPASLAESDRHVARIQFDSLYVCEGVASHENDVTEFEFRFRNLGQTDLRVGPIEAGCDCIHAYGPKHAIGPGEEDVIHLRYRHQGGGEAFHHSIKVHTNDPYMPMVMLQAVGYTGTFAVSPTKLYFDNVAVGESRSAMVYIKSDRDRALAAITRVSASAKCIDIRLGDRGGVPAGAQLGGIVGSREAGVDMDVAEVIFQPSMEDVGQETYQVTFTTSDVDHPTISVPVIAHAVLPVRAFPEVVSFGELDGRSDAPIERVLELRAYADLEFEIVRFICEGASIAVKVDGRDSLGRSRIRVVASGADLSRIKDREVSAIVRMSGQDEEFAVPIGLSWY
ncbi:MAG: DUF1573 domain-containing protein [Planctomycetaceae bacterium]|nr:DUF1573 domain-containing protein [Planctomycetaceae bacterium]